MSKIKSFQDLEVWQVAHALVLDTYRVSARFPPAERFGLTDQVRRASVSVPANIAEGFARRGKKEKLHFLNIAQGSLSELSYYFILLRDLGLMGDISALLDRCDHIARMLHNLSLRIGE